MKAGLLCIFVLSAGVARAEFPTYGTSAIEKETLEWTWEKAQKFSGIQSVNGLQGLYAITVYRLTRDELKQNLCPENPSNCANIGGLYDTVKKRILLRDDLTPEDDIISDSFLMHEMVHALQNQTRSDEEMFGSCEKLYATEKQAYDAQDAFLKSEGQFFRAGAAIRFFFCNNASSMSPAGSSTSSFKGH